MGTRKTNAARQKRPNPDWIRGVCPRCGEELVSNCYYVKGRGYLVVWECWSSRTEDPACDYRRVL
jgi:transcription elongation factor Elf1